MKAEPQKLIGQSQAGCRHPDGRKAHGPARMDQV
jgi:hypothetical protein